MEQLMAGTSEVYLDFMIVGFQSAPLIVSYFERSAQIVRSVGAALVTDGVLVYRHRSYRNTEKFSVNYATIQRGKEKFTHGLAIAENLTKDYLVTTEEDLYKDLYYLLMNNYDLPLLEWWIPKLYEEMKNKKTLFFIPQYNYYGNLDRTIKKHGKDVPVKDIMVCHISLTEEILKEMIVSLFRRGQIWITKKEQKVLHFENLDEYFKEYGKSIVDNLKSILKPVSELNGKIDRAVLNNIRLYPQQAAMVNGIYEYFRKTKGRYALFSMGTGSGKTIQAATAAEMLYVGKWLEEHPDKTLKDAYEKDGVINYRHVIMCPGHLVEKWCKELRERIPYAKPVIIDTFSQLVALREGGSKRDCGKEYYVISKDFLKLSYQRIPTPKKEAVRNVEVFKCKDCGMVQARNYGKCMGCKSENMEIVKTEFKRSGLICPHCNRLLFPTNYTFDVGVFMDELNENSWPMHWYDMSAERNHNQTCIYCGESLWMPYVKNINTEFGYEKKPAWIRQTFWSNRAKKGKVTNWVLRGYEHEAKRIYGEVLNSMEDSLGGCRKYSPALYIKKYLKGYFDVFICDEVHKAKGGSTAQGNAFHHIMKAAKYTFGLTGTIAGGVATDLFYILYRLEPGRMKEHGYLWTSVMKFATDYGCVETEFSADVNLRNNVCSRGRQLRQPKVLPGISPKIFSDFLLDRAVFLNIEDMSANMPPLYERIKLCKPKPGLETEMLRHYNRVIGIMKRYERDFKVPLASVRHQFGMSYLDKPYGVEPILDPKSGCEVVTPKDYRLLLEDGGMLSKEEMLIDIVKQELSEGRNCVIYAEYTQSEATNVLPRLQELILKHCNLQKNEVVVMRASYPSSAAREAWMHARAKEGMKVMLCNPRLCETGLDFCWMEKSITYNYPTLIFYQSGYSLFIMWQAAGRAWRLNQREECRTYYLAYEMTVQQAILQVLGEKKAATSAIQGRFSADGLAAMAKGVDTQVRIAQIMSEMDEQTGNKLQEMFDVITGEVEDTFGDEQTMLMFSELIERVEEVRENLGIEAYSLFDLFSSFTEDTKEEDLFDMSMFSMMSQFNDFISNIDVDDTVVNTTPKKKKRRAKVYANCSLF